MRYEFTVGRSCRVKTFLKEHDISKGLLAKIKFEGGHIWVNGEEQFATYPVHEGDVVAIEIPDEAPHETLKPIPFDLDIVYEDDNFLVINKPYGYAHARMDKQLQQKSIKKHYYALVEGDTKLEEQGEIIAPIARDVDSIITRRVHKSGKYAHTSYRLVADYGRVKLVDINLHTGRTHQIRVHFAHLGLPLLGDDLYGGSLDYGIKRQALHCHRLAFIDPFTKKEMVHASSLTDDFETVIMNLQTKKD